MPLILTLTSDTTICGQYWKVSFHGGAMEVTKASIVVVFINVTTTKDHNNLSDNAHGALISTITMHDNA